VTQAEAVDAVVRRARSGAGRTLFVGVDGPGGAGKSTLAARLAAAVRGQVVSVDDFAGPDIPEWDWHRFDAQVVRPLVAGRLARYERRSWDGADGADGAGSADGPDGAGSPDWAEVRPGGVLVVEGVSATRAESTAPWDLRIWVEAPPGVRLARVLERDGGALREKWLQDWIPSEEAYIAAQRPAERADLIVSGTE
jgi:hypothetical protein